MCFYHNLNHSKLIFSYKPVGLTHMTRLYHSYYSLFSISSLIMKNRNMWKEQFIKQGEVMCEVRVKFGWREITPLYIGKYYVDKYKWWLLKLSNEKYSKQQTVMICSRLTLVLRADWLPTIQISPSYWHARQLKN